MYSGFQVAHKNNIMTFLQIARKHCPSYAIKHKVSYSKFVTRRMKHGSGDRKWPSIENPGIWHMRNGSCICVMACSIELYCIQKSRVSETFLPLLCMCIHNFMEHSKPIKVKTFLTAKYLISVVISSINQKQYVLCITLIILWYCWHCMKSLSCSRIEIKGTFFTC